MDIFYEREIGKRIRSERKKRHMTQEELSAKLQLRGCDITRSTIAKIEVGQRHIYLDEIMNIKEIFRLEFNYLFYGTDI